ncbi:PQQ-binding-like beta-propeller repeat protein [Streptomyces sp. NPDC051310]|uniref:protein kinase domain-containing protein n=1 Tax=Streptomyces sp. NPDC051310 TaxID=3365649 RepID=UPI0037B891BE
MPPLPGYAGHYRLEARLGSGGMGVVHLATSASGLRLAVKVVHEQYAADPEFRARFRQEVAAARRVSGAFTAPVVDADPDAERPWMATLYVPGPTLADQVKRNGPMAPAELRRLTAGLAEALRDIHRAGVVHRDLKPGNVLLTDTGPRVIDFGISRPVDSDLRTETGKLIGSPPYMAPEQFQRPRQVGPAADVFALGSVLVHASTGQGPFDDGSPYIVAYQVVHDEPDLSGVPAALVPLVSRCLAKDPAERPTPDEIMAELGPPSYEATAFIPAQRRRATGLPAHAPAQEPTPAFTPRDRTGRGPSPRSLPAPAAAATAATAAPAPASPSSSPSASRPAGPEAEAGAGRRRRARWPLVAAAAVALVVSGGVTTWSLGGPEQDPAPEAAAAVAATPWRAELGSAARDAAPHCAYARGELYCSAPGAGLARLDPRDGRVLWSRAAGGPGEPSAPVVSGGLVHTVAQDTAARNTTGQGAPARTTLGAYEAADGAPAWSADVSAYRGEVHHAGATVLLAAPSGRVKGVDGATGRTRWQHALRGHSHPRFGPYSPGTGLVYVFEVAGSGATTLVSGVRPTDGAVVWQRPLTGDLTPVGTSGDALLLTSRDRDSQTDALVRYEPGAREARRVPLPFPMAEPQVALRGDVAYLLARNGTLVAVDTRGARELWRLETAAGRVSRPVTGGGDRLYFSAADGRLLAVDTARGALLGQTPPRLRGGKLGYAAALPAPLVTGEGTVVAAAPDGSVFAVPAKDPAAW